jgi:copper(I)-binding protein
MPHLRLALAAGGLLLAVPALSSCGFDYPTERVNTVGAGVTDRDNEVDVAGAVIVAGQSDSGTFIGTLANNTEDDIRLTSLTGGEKGSIEPDSFKPVDVPGRGHQNLATLAEEGDGITVTGDFEAGDFVTVTLDFDNDESVTMELPVVKPCYQFEGLDTSQTADEAGEDTEEDPRYSCEVAESPEAPAEH